MLKSSLKLALKVLARRKFFTFISLFGIAMTLVVLMVATAVLDNFFAPRAPESRFDRVAHRRARPEHGPDDTESSKPGHGFLDRPCAIRRARRARRRSTRRCRRPSIYRRRRAASKLPSGAPMATTGRSSTSASSRAVRSALPTKRPTRQVVVITDDARDRSSSAATSALGKTFNIGGAASRVIGVVPACPLTQRSPYMRAVGADRPAERPRSDRQLHGQLQRPRSWRTARADFPMMQREFQTRVSHVSDRDPKTYTRDRAGLDTPFESFARDLTDNSSARAY